MGAAVAEARHRVRVGQHGIGGVERALGVVEQRHVEHAAPAIGQHVVQGDLVRREAPRGGDGGDGGVGGGLIVGLGAHQMHPRPGAHPRALAGRGFGEQPGAELRIAQARHPLGQRGVR